MLKRLEGMGYVRRERDSVDERNVHIYLTDAGRALREKGFGFGSVTMKASGLEPEEFARPAEDSGAVARTIWSKRARNDPS